MNNSSEDQLNNLSTIILRFRDLVTDRGVTIESHKQIAGEPKGHVWWGWWHKLGEAVPDEAFRRLSAKAEAGGFELFLFDTGQNLLYKATCLELDWDKNHNEKKSPEAGSTPKYYNDKSTLAWFKLSDFKEVSNPEEALHGFSYLQVDDLFEERPSRYTPFYNKRVSSLHELQLQNRTIWFLRPFESGDGTHEVSLLDRKSFSPEHFSSEYFESPGRSLLWVSDLHFSVDGHHAFPPKPDHVSSDLGYKIGEAVRGLDAGPFAGLVISGDITWKALPDEFEQAKDFINRGLSWQPSFQSEQIAVCPGNHDLKFSDDPADKAQPVTVVRDEYKAAYSQFYQDLFYLAPNQFLSCGRRFLLGKSIPVDIVCLNSSFLQQQEHVFQGQGFIGQAQMEDAAEQMGWVAGDAASRAVRIIVLHHHILPTTYREQPAPNYMYSVVLDEEALARWIVEHKVNLVLHGHMHQPFRAKIGHPPKGSAGVQDWHDFYVLGMGSSGVAKKHLGETPHNTIGVLTFNRRSVKVTVLSVDSVNPSTEIWAVELPLDY